MNKVTLLDVIRISVANVFASAVLWLIPGKTIYSHAVNRISAGINELAEVINDDD